MPQLWSVTVDRTRTYTIVLTPDEEGGFLVHVPALPEVVTGGDTEEEALAMAREAIELVLESRAESGEQVPVEHEPRLRKLTVDVPTVRRAKSGFVLGRRAFAKIAAVEGIEMSTEIEQDLRRLQSAAPQHRRATLTQKYGKE